MSLPADHPDRYKRTKHVYYDNDGKVDECRWIVLDQHAVRAGEFHGRFATEHDGNGQWRKLQTGDFKGLWFYPHGIELHSSKKPREDSEPVKCCPLLGTDCYPNGTSLGALHFAEWWFGDDETAFAHVLSWMTRNDREENPT